MPHRAAGICCALALATAAHAGILARDDDAIVMTGVALPSLAGEDPSRLVAFSWAGGWVQIPVQVDERAVVDFGTVYNTAPVGQTFLTYTDDGTFTGADADTGFDADDELVLRAADAEAQFPGGADPPGVLAGSRVELQIDDPLDGRRAWIYLFRSNGSLDPAAGTSDVSYTFDLLSGDYKTTYNVNTGPNPEDSVVSTAAYGVHFSDRWIRDGTSITAGSASGVDVLDRHKNQFSPSQCGRTEDTFSAGEGAFIVNRTGPIRALRGYLGANSGPTSHRIHRFYAAREVVEIVLRVHEIPGVMDYFDYVPAAAGMTYRNDNNLTGVTIDGTPDGVTAGALSWELVSGAQGSLAVAYELLTDIPSFDTTSYYSDSTNPNPVPCTGEDAEEWGASGFRRIGPIPNTDPGDPLQPANKLSLVRTLRYGDVDQPVSFAQDNLSWVLNPLEVTVDGVGGCPDADLDGWVDCTGCTPSSGQQCGECDDLDPGRNPGARERCDGLDNDCDGATADGIDESWYGAACDGSDSDVCDEGLLRCTTGRLACDDATSDDVESCGNGQDDDCDGFVDGADGECSGEDAFMADAGVRGWTGPGFQVVIGGFIIHGTGPKTVLVRALGPSADDGNIGPMLQDPTLELFDQDRTLLDQNDDWGSSPDAAAIAATGLAPGAATEPAVLAVLQPGEYTAVVRTKGVDGFARVEAIEVDAAEPATLSNLSTRGEANALGRLLAGTFTIGGTTQRQVVVRALGPTLSMFGIPDVQADPLLTVTSGSVPLAQNDDWADGPDAATIQALGFAPPNPAESAVLLTLAPGTYTVIASGAGGDVGIGLVEIYDPAAGAMPAIWLERIRDVEVRPDAPPARTQRGPRAIRR